MKEGEDVPWLPQYTAVYVVGKSESFYGWKADAYPQTKTVRKLENKKLSIFGSKATRALVSTELVQVDQTNGDSKMID
jgi:hypothetical protein